MAGKQRLNVLVVDRDEGCALELKDLLTREGYDAEVLSEPERAAEEVKRGRYQLVLLDITAPDSDGVGALARIRSVDSDVCVIAMTGLPSVESAVHAMRHDAFHYLQKPLELDELRRILREAIQAKGLLVDRETRLNREVGARLRERRKSAGLTLKQLANRTQLSVSLISQIELGRSAASVSTLHKLAAALQVRMTYFFETV